MFTPESRQALRAELIAHATADSRLTGIAITGSAAQDREDRWSDIDLAFGVADPNAIPAALADFTAYLYNRHHAAHHIDVHAGAWIYRVFLLPDTLQVDLAFAPASDFRPLAPTFRLVSGSAEPPQHFPQPTVEYLAGMGWLFALHARSSIARGQSWQAEYMISGIRDHALTLTCLHHGLSTYHGRGFDQLPPAVLAQFEPTMVRSLDPQELSRAFHATVVQLLNTILAASPTLAAQLDQPLRCLLTP